MDTAVDTVTLHTGQADMDTLFDAAGIDAPPAARKTAGPVVTAILQSSVTRQQAIDLAAAHPHLGRPAGHAHSRIPTDNAIAEHAHRYNDAGLADLLGGNNPHCHPPLNEAATRATMTHGGPRTLHNVVYRGTTAPHVLTEHRRTILSHVDQPDTSLYVHRLMDTGAHDLAADLLRRDDSNLKVFRLACDGNLPHGQFDLHELAERTAAAAADASYLPLFIRHPDLADHPAHASRRDLALLAAAAANGDPIDGSLLEPAAQSPYGWAAGGDPRQAAARQAAHAHPHLPDPGGRLFPAPRGSNLLVERPDLDDTTRWLRWANSHNSLYRNLHGPLIAHIAAHIAASPSLPDRIRATAATTVATPARDRHFSNRSDIPPHDRTTSQALLDRWPIAAYDRGHTPTPTGLHLTADQWATFGHATPPTGQSLPIALYAAAVTALTSELRHCTNDDPQHFVALLDPLANTADTNPDMTTGEILAAL